MPMLVSMDGAAQHCQWRRRAGSPVRQRARQLRVPGGRAAGSATGLFRRARTALLGKRGRRDAIGSAGSGQAALCWRGDGRLGAIQELVLYDRAGRGPRPAAAPVCHASWPLPQAPHRPASQDGHGCQVIALLKDGDEQAASYWLTSSALAEASPTSGCDGSVQRTSTYRGEFHRRRPSVRTNERPNRDAPIDHPLSPSSCPRSAVTPGSVSRTRPRPFSTRARRLQIPNEPTKSP